MNPNIQHISQGQLVGNLPPNEKQILIDKLTQNAKFDKLIIIICCCTFYLIIPIVIGIGFFIAMRVTKGQIAKITNDQLAVYRVIGELTWRVNNQVNDDYFKNYKIRGDAVGYLTRKYDPTMFIVGGVSLPQAIVGLEGKYLLQYAGQTITFDYIPSISKNRLYVDDSGRGYNFLTKTTI